VITQSGSQTSGYVVEVPGIEDLAGTTSQEGRDVGGSSPVPGNTLYFQWHLLDNGDQFVGSYYLADVPDRQSYCGARNRQPQPSPCEWP